MWQPDEIRVLRWFMRFAGLGLIIPGVIYLFAWPDTILAFSAVVGESVAPAAAVVTIAGSMLGGLAFLLARHGKIGAIVAGISLLLGSVVHLQWSWMMQSRLEAIPKDLSEEQTALLTDTIFFAANAQIPHLLKNLVLAGMCVMFFLLAPRLCGSRVGDRPARRAPTTTPPTSSPARGPS